MIANYHTHTTRCSHVYGTGREYVEYALKAGLETLGFSDRTAYVFLGRPFRDRPMRMKPEELQTKNRVLLQKDRRGEE